jgi:amino acid adenylation domain-containing protein
MEKHPTAGFRLSPQQKRVYMLQQGDHSQVYRAQCAVLIEGALDVEALREAVNCVVSRHEILRTVFHRQPGMRTPLQIIEGAGRAAWERVELDETERNDAEELVAKSFARDKEYAFDLERGPMIHVLLAELKTERHLLVLGVPSLCADARTLRNVVKEIGRCYAACKAGESLPDEPVQYLQYSEWQHNLLADEDAQPGMAYWRKRLSQLTPGVKLPTEIEPGNGRDFAPASLLLKFSPQLSERIEEVSVRHSTSTAVFLLACWQILLWRLTGQSAPSVGILLDERGYEELNDAMGLFARSLPVACYFDGNFLFSEVLSRLQEIMVEAGEWQEYYTPDLVEPSADGSDRPAFGFEYREEHARQLQVENLTFSICGLSSCTEPFKVKLSATREGDLLKIELHYDRALLEPESVERLADHFSTLVESAATNPHSDIWRLQLLTEEERSRLLVEWNDTSVRYAPEQKVPDLFEAQARQTPEAVAVVFENERLTYRELNARANRVAHHLQRSGVKPDVPVGLYVERSVEMLVGLLGILKAGGAYLPLDPALPQDRLAFMLEDARAPVLLTQQSLLKSLPAHSLEVRCLDSDWETFARESDANAVNSAGRQNLAYVIYTSGSTGRPKAVAVEHAQLTNYVNAILEKLALPGGSHFALVSSFATDLGHTAIFPSLCGGGCLHVISRERLSQADLIASYFEQQRPDCLKIVPSHLSALLSDSRARQILPGRRLVLGGEASSWNLAAKVRELAPTCRIINHYGPTETTVGVLTFRLEDGAAQRTHTLPLGRPLANTRIYILDPQLQPLPVGCPGELYIGGAGVARGYLNHPGMTAEKFIPDPFGAEAGQRLYRSGDLARYLPDGQVEFLGRADRQVKIRGYRVEPAEIEAALMEHPKLREVAVVARDAGADNKSLTAYVVPAQPAAPRTEELQDFLDGMLPPYMIPSAFVPMKSLPLTPGGKLDYAALPPPDRAGFAAEENYVAPRTPIEAAVAEAMCQLLSLERVGVHDNFFQIGGHSLLATQLVSRMQESFGVELSLRSLFAAPTVAGLAVAVVQGRVEQVSNEESSGLLTQLEQLSEEDVRALLAEE